MLALRDSCFKPCTKIVNIEHAATMAATRQPGGRNPSRGRHGGVQIYREMTAWRKPCPAQLCWVKFSSLGWRREAKFEPCDSKAGAGRVENICTFV